MSAMQNIFQTKILNKERVNWKISILFQLYLVFFQETLKYDFDDHCEVNVNNRHVCSYC